ncbi:hypothetical protein [Streptomyces sp. CAU 1734]|uniref:PspA-associated protein PspAB n=1 Tax=Streptomyces sp. CAU 1734 TaxID=3140360 RepID=UPI0032605ACA
MGFLDAILGRSRPVRPDLDRLFGLPGAAVTLEAGAGFTPTGAGSVCFSRVEGGAFARLEEEVRNLLDADTATAGRGTEHGVNPAAGYGGGVPVEFSRDSYGYAWILARHPGDPDGISSLVNDLHAVNTMLEEAEFGAHLLCSLVAFHQVSDGRQRGLALVYLYKRGTFYPFAPLPGAAERRDTALELQIRALLSDDLPMESDPGRWFPLWGAPGLAG